MRSVPRRLVEGLAVGVVYYVAAKLSLRLALVGESVTPLWPPTGVALVGILWFGSRIWPAVALSAFLVNLPISPSPAAAAGIAIGNTVAPLLARRLLEAAEFRRELDRVRDVLALVFLGALAGMTVSATAGTTSLLASGAIRSDAYASTWSVWWTGDAMGILAVAPFLLSLRPVRRPVSAPPATRILEAAVLFGGLAAASYSLQRTDRPVWVAVFPLLGWAAWRFRQRGAGPGALLVIVMATWAAAHDHGPFAGSGLLQKMVMLQVFNAAVAITSFFFAAVVTERERAEAERQRSVEREREVQARLYERERRVAQTLQRSLLPEELPDFPDLQTAARYIPAAGDVDIGGDWYDLVPLPNGRVGLGIGDVAGHGESAAAAMGQVRMALRAYFLEGMKPARILDRLNALLHELLPGVMTTLACAELDLESGAMVLARAGHPPPLVLTPAGDVRLVEGGAGPPLGVMPQVVFEEASAALPHACTLLLYTDGLIERRRESLDQGLLRLDRALRAAPGDLDEACDAIVGSLIGAVGTTDDAALLAVRRVSLAEMPLRMTLLTQPARLAPMRQILGRWLRQNGCTPGEASEIIVACTEACTNAVQHAYASAEGSMEIEATAEAGAVAIRVRDFGSWTDRSSPSDQASRGLQLMRGLMDSVEVTSGPGGTSVLMQRRTRGAPANA